MNKFIDVKVSHYDIGDIVYIRPILFSLEMGKDVILAEILDVEMDSGIYEKNGHYKVDIRYKVNVIDSFDFLINKEFTINQNEYYVSYQQKDVTYPNGSYHPINDVDLKSKLIKKIYKPKIACVEFINGLIHLSYVGHKNHSLILPIDFFKDYEIENLKNNIQDLIFVNSKHENFINSMEFFFRTVNNNFHVIYQNLQNL